MIDATELPPFTFEQKQALRDCRFVTCYGNGTPVLAITPDKAIADALGAATTPFQPDKTVSPERWEYECMTSHPEAVPVAQEIMATQAAARARAQRAAPLGASRG